jgi:DNA-binding response OmpR family regulator
MNDERKITILNVDDDEAGRHAVSRILETHGFDVVVAADGVTTQPIRPRASSSPAVL